MSLRIGVAIALLTVVIVNPLRALDLGRAEGTLVVHGTATPLRFVYGKHAASVRSGAKSDVLILLTSEPLSESALRSEGEQLRLVKNGRMAEIELRLAENLRPVRTVVHHRDLPPSNIAGDLVRFTSTIASQRLVDGAITYAGSDESFVTSFRVRIGEGDSFAPNPAATAELELPRPPELPPATLAPAPMPGGAPLPSGGGAPGKALLAYEEAFRRGDIPAAKRLSTAAAAADLEQMKDLMPIARAATPMNIKVTAGTSSGNRATLQLSGTPTMPGGSTGTATMVKEGNQWKFAAWAWPAPATAKASASRASAPPPAIAPVTNGTPLPADGGDPGKAWRAFDTAMNRGDVPAIKKVLLDESAQHFDQAVPLLDLMQGSRGVNAHVVGGMIKGDKATLRLQGQPATMAVVTGNGTVTMVKEHGVWKMAGEAWTPKK